MTVKELIAHLQGFDEDAVVVVNTCDENGDPDGIVQVESRDIEPRGNKYIIFFDQMPFSEEDIDEILA